MSIMFNEICIYIYIYIYIYILSNTKSAYGGINSILGFSIYSTHVIQNPNVGIIYKILALSPDLSALLRFSLGNSIGVSFFWLDIRATWLFSSGTCVFRLFFFFYEFFYDFFPRISF